MTSKLAEAIGSAFDPKHFISHPDDALADVIKIYMDTSIGSYLPTDVMRVSHLFNLCPREFVLQRYNPKENVKFDMTSTMKMQAGTDFHSFMQNHVLGPLGILWGKWDFATPDSTSPVIGFYEDAVKLTCDICTIKFVEETLYEPDPIVGILGHCDGRISLPRLNWLIENQGKLKKDINLYKEISQIDVGELALLEIKTIGGYALQKFLESGMEIQDYYKMQACLYMEFTGIKKTYFLFVDRTDFKFYGKIYHFDPGWVTEARRKARKIREAIGLKVLPDMRACLGPKDARAKKCAHVKECWDDNLDIVKLIEEGDKKKVTLGLT